MSTPYYGTGSSNNIHTFSAMRSHDRHWIEIAPRTAANFPLYYLDSLDAPELLPSGSTGFCVSGGGTQRAFVEHFRR